MAQIPNDVDFGDYEKSSFGTITDGWYDVEVVEGDYRINGGKHRATLTVEVIGPSGEGHRIKTGYNLVHPSKKAQDISRSQWKDTWFSLGLKTQPGNTDELLGLKASVKVKTKPAEGEYPARNEIAAWKPYGQAPKEDKPAAADEGPGW